MLNTDSEPIGLVASLMHLLPGKFLRRLVAIFKANITYRRWVFYVLLIWTGVLLASMIFLVPETYHPVYEYPISAT